jgi:hypothetical protein
MENVGVGILWPFGIYYGQFVYDMTFWSVIFPPFWYNATRKIWQPWTTYVRLNNKGVFITHTLSILTSHLPNN